MYHPKVEVLFTTNPYLQCMALCGVLGRKGPGGEPTVSKGVLLPSACVWLSPPSGHPASLRLIPI